MISRKRITKEILELWFHVMIIFYKFESDGIGIFNHNFQKNSLKYKIAPIYYFIIQNIKG